MCYVPAVARKGPRFRRATQTDSVLKDLKVRLEAQTVERTAVIPSGREIGKNLRQLASKFSCVHIGSL